MISKPFLYNKHALGNTVLYWNTAVLMLKTGPRTLNNTPIKKCV